MHSCRPARGQPGPGSVRMCHLSWEEVFKRPDCHWGMNCGPNTKLTQSLLYLALGRDHVRMTETWTKRSEGAVLSEARHLSCDCRQVGSDSAPLSGPPLCCLPPPIPNPHPSCRELVAALSSPLAYPCHLATRCSLSLCTGVMKELEASWSAAWCPAGAERESEGSSQRVAGPWLAVQPASWKEPVSLA